MDWEDLNVEEDLEGVEAIVLKILYVYNSILAIMFFLLKIYEKRRIAVESHMKYGK